MDCDAEDDQIIVLNSLLQNRESQIGDLEADLERSKDLIHFLQLQNRQMSGQMEIYETRPPKYRREAQKAQVKLEEYMGEFDNVEEEEEPVRKRPRTMGLRKALEKQREEESTLA